MATATATKTSLNVNSSYFKLYRAYSNSINSSNVGKFFWGWILKDCIKVQEKKKKVALCSCPQQNVKLGLSCCSCAATAKKRTKCDMQSCCFANLTLLLCCRSCWRHRRRCLSSLIIKEGGAEGSLRSRSALAPIIPLKRFSLVSSSPMFPTEPWESLWRRQTKQNKECYRPTFAPK